MTDTQLLSRITADPGVLTGKPVVRGTRLAVEYLVKFLAHGATEAEILAEYQGLTKNDISACLLFASKSLEESAFMPLISVARPAGIRSVFGVRPGARRGG